MINLENAENQKNEVSEMNVLYTTNDIFCAKVGTGICSIFENNSDLADITVYIIGQEISDSNQERFQRLADCYNRTIELIDLGNLKHFFPFDFETLGWNPVILARLVLDKLLPESVERILYLDGDTVNLRSLKELWEFPLGDSVLGGCIEATVSQNRREELGMADLPYINSGVLLINLDKWRREHWGDTIISYYREHDGRLFAPDQDAINGALLDHIAYLPPKYNFYNIYWFYPYRFLKKRMNDTFYYSKEVFDESLEHPAIIHYLGEERPWRAGNHHRFKADYQKYLNLTPWKGDAEEEGWKTYFFFWDIFNGIMRPFPALRYRIIDHLIPAFMKWRKRQLQKETNRK